MVIHSEKPPMGWNTWNVYLGVPDDKTLKSNAEYMSKNLLSSGYEYFVLDALWYENDNTGDWSFDEFGILQPDPEKFPDGMKAFSDYIHSLGLKFGLHMMRGINTHVIGKGCKIKETKASVDSVIDYSSPCFWSDKNGWYGVKADNPLSQKWYEGIISQFAQWNVDFIKYDDLGSPLKTDEIILIENAINKCGRDMVLSISPGNKATVDDSEFYSDHCTMWRITGDFWDDQKNFYRSFEKLSKWNEFIQKDGWPDGDMLPLGWICENPHVEGDEPRICRFTVDERKSLMTLFSISKSPLILTCSLLRNTEDLLSLQTKPDCIKINQTGSPTVLKSTEEYQLWYSKTKENDYLALFNLSQSESEIKIEIPEHLTGKSATDVWNNNFLQINLDKSMSFMLNAHGVILLKI